MSNWVTLLKNRIKATIGHEFYVDGINGSDALSGRVRTQPVKLIETALDRCENGRHDYIYVIDCWGGEAFPITVDKTTVHIIAMGVSYEARMSMPWCTLSSGAQATFELTAASHYCEIAGFQMGADATHPCILVSAGVAGFWLHHNALATQIATQDGISIVGGDLSNGLVEWNLFGKELIRDGIRGGSLSEAIIQDNILSRYGGVGINIGGEPYAILRNKFYRGWGAIGAAAGWGISMTGANCLVDGNEAMESGSAPQNNPYKDLSTGTPGTTKNGWGKNWSGGVTVMPDVA